MSATASVIMLYLYQRLQLMVSAAMFVKYKGHLKGKQNLRF